MNMDTIAAISTGLSNAGISIIRMSGANAFSIIDAIFAFKREDRKVSYCESHTVHYGYIKEENQIIDEVMVLILKAPKTYTREDIVEIDCHGGVLVTKKILELIISKGAKLAEPGEFTKRAFLNGRIDLSQAESVMDIIHSKNELALKTSINQLKGNILNEINIIRTSLIRDTAFIESALDDPEHISLEGFSDECRNHVKDNLIKLNKLYDSCDNGRMLKEGIQTVILGRPNVGKSSLLNLFLGEDRAIVTDIAGTTRDTLEELIQIHGINLNMIDTAGIRETNDEVEKIGVNKAREAALKSDLILYVVDSSSDLLKEDYDIIDFIKDKKSIVLLNKSDLPSKIDSKKIESLTGKDAILISAKENIGIHKLEEKIKNLFFEGKINFNEEIFITNIRHKNAIYDSIQSLEQVMSSIENNMSEDFYCIDLMNAYELLGSITGESVGEDLINTIFKEFCMGK